MEKSEVNKGAFVDYSDFVQKNGRILAKRKAGFHSNEVLEMMIEEYVLMIQSEVRHLDYLDTAFMSSTRQIAIYMAELAECITRRYFKGRHMELSDSMLDLLIRDFRTALKRDGDRDVLIKMIPATGVSEKNGLISSVKGFTFYVGDEAVLGVRTFEDDRFNNEAMVSCDQSRENGFYKSCRVISKNYIFGENGVFVNASSRSFLDTFCDTGRDDFLFNPELEYYYFPYLGFIDGVGKYVYIDRSNGVRKVFFDEGEKLYSFRPVLLDCAFVGGPLKDNEEIMAQAFKCEEESFKPKQLVKLKQDE